MDEQREHRISKEFVVERNGKTFVLYAGLLERAHDEGLNAITTTLLQIPGPDNGHVAIVMATVTTSKGTFCGLGDAAPDNVAKPMVTCLIRMAETRAKARALRDATNIGATALEELGEGSTGLDEGDAPPAEPATDKQMYAIYRRFEEKEGWGEGQTDAFLDNVFVLDDAALAKHQASAVLDWLNGKTAEIRGAKAQPGQMRQTSQPYVEAAASQGIRAVPRQLQPGEPGGPEHASPPRGRAPANTGELLGEARFLTKKLRERGEQVEDVPNSVTAEWLLSNVPLLRERVNRGRR